MRHPWLTIILFMVLASCSEPLEIDKGKVERILQMDAIFDSSDTLHVLKLCWSTGNSVDTVSLKDKPSATMYVNGIKTSDSFIDGASGELFLEGKFHEGDVIKIKATAGFSDVEAEVTAPSSVAISKIDTSRLDNKMYFTTSIKDNPGEKNYFRVSIWKNWNAYVTETFDTWPPLGYVLGEWRKEMKVFGEEDPILSSKLDFVSKNHDDEWHMNIFTDETFRDGEYALRIYTADDYSPYIPVRTSSYTTVCDMDVTIRLHSMSSEAFRYLDDYNFQGTDNSFLMAYPTIFPSNVKGGIGFVTAVTSFDYVVRFPSYIFPAE